MDKLKKLAAFSLSVLLIFLTVIPVSAVEIGQETSQEPPADYSEVYIETEEDAETIENANTADSESINEDYEVEIEEPQEESLEVEAEAAVLELDSSEFKELIINAVRNDYDEIDVSSYGVSVDLTNGKHILSDFQDDLFYEYAEDTFCVQSLTFTQENGKIISIKINYTDSASVRNQMRSEVSAKIDYIVNAVKDISDETEKIGKIAELIWSDYYDDFSFVDIHTHDVYGCLVRGYASRFGAAIAFQAVMNRFGYEGGYYLSGADIYSKNLIGDTWKYTNIAWNQSRKRNAYLLTDVKESTKTYSKAALSESEYTPASLFSDDIYMSEKGVNGEYFNEQIIQGNTSFTLPEKVYFNYRRGNANYLTRIKHEYPESAILVSSISSSVKNDMYTVTNVEYRESDPTLRAEMLAKFYAERDKIVQRANTFESDTQKIIFVNNYITKTTTYKEYEDGVKLPYSHDVYGCLVNGECVCEGYATAFHEIMKQLGINDTYVHSYNHIWNKVLLDGQYKTVDVTNNYDNSYLLSDTHEANTPNGTMGLSRYFYVFSPTLSMKSTATQYLIQQVAQGKTHINTTGVNFWLDIRAKKFDTKWYIDTLKNIYPVEMRDVDSMEFVTDGDIITSVDVTYKERSADDIQAFETIINGIIAKAADKPTESEKVAAVMSAIYSSGIKGSLSGEEDPFVCAVSKSGSYLAKTRVCCYVLEKLGIRYNVIKDSNVYYYVKNVYDGVARYSSPCLSGYINLEAIKSYRKFNYYPVYDFLNPDLEDAYIDGDNAEHVEHILMDNVTVTGISNKTYTGNSITQNLTLKYGQTTLIENTDYTVTYKNNTDAGTAKIIFTGLGSYIGTVEKTFTIKQASISDYTISGIEESYVYEGADVFPTMTVSSGDKILEKGKDYTVTYANNTKPGTATLTIRGIGNYAGTQTIQFLIVRKINTFEITGLESEYTYTGTQIRPPLQVACEGETLTAGTDYSVSYSNNINVGTANIHIVGINNYNAEYNLTFEITPKSISLATATIPQDRYEYTGSQIIPEVAVKDGTKTLRPDTDYTVSYDNNVEDGLAVISIEGTGNYSGAKTITFEIFKVDDTPEFVITGLSQTYTYTGKEIKPSLKVTCEGTLLKLNTDYTIAYSNNTDVGTATVTIKGIGSYSREYELNYEILQAPLTGLTITLPQFSYDYTAKPIEPIPVVIKNLKVLVKDKDYILRYQNNTGPGTAYVVIEGLGNYKGSVKKAFTINKLSVEDYQIVGVNDTYQYSAKTIMPTLTVKNETKTLVKNKDYTVTCSNNVNIGTATITVTGRGKYVGVIKKQFEIVPAPATSMRITGLSTSYQYTGNPITPTPTIKLGTKTFTEGVDYTLEYQNNVNVGTATIVIKGMNSFYGTTTKTFKISAIPMSQCLIGGLAGSYAFTGDYVKPQPFITHGADVLVKGVDYTLSYLSNKNAGTAKIIVKGMGKYSGSVTMTFAITPIPLKDITINNLLNSYVYTGSQIKPSISVVQNGRTLSRTTDYTVTYRNNVDVGKAEIVISGGKNYTGEIVKSFNITPKNVSGITLSTSTTETFKYDNLTFPLLIVKHSSKALVEGVDYTLTYSLVQNKLTVTVHGIGNYQGTKTKILTAK